MSNNVCVHLTQLCMPTLTSHAPNDASYHHLWFRFKLLQIILIIILDVGDMSCFGNIVGQVTLTLLRPDSHSSDLEGLVLVLIRGCHISRFIDMENQVYRFGNIEGQTVVLGS